MFYILSGFKTKLEKSLIYNLSKETSVAYDPLK